MTAIVCAVAAALLTPLVRSETTQDTSLVSLWIHVALAGALGAGAAALASDAPELVAFAAAGTLCALLVVIDLTELRLPDKFVLAALGALLVPLAVAAATTGAWPDFGRSVLASAACLAGYFALAWISPSGLGLGDVKFAAVIGAFLGWFSWRHVGTGTLLAFALSAVVALGFLISGRASRKTGVPFGPAMLAGALLSFLVLPVG
nr:A24 family peptidase [Tessaracoccus sp. OS52]